MHWCEWIFRIFRQRSRRILGLNPLSAVWQIVQPPPTFCAYGGRQGVMLPEPSPLTQVSVVIAAVPLITLQHAHIYTAPPVPFTHINFWHTQPTPCSHGGGTLARWAFNCASFSHKLELQNCGTVELWNCSCIWSWSWARTWLPADKVAVNAFF